MELLIIGIMIGFLIASIRLNKDVCSSFRPSQEWKPEANTDDAYQTAAYQAAGVTLGVRVKLGPPVPCEAGTSACRGMTGIWIHREDAANLKHNQFTDQMWSEWSRITR
jgi:hypothetical protein